MNFNLSVKNKIFTLFVVVIVVSVSAIGWFGFKSAKESYINSALSINNGEVKALSNEIKGVLGTIPDDVIYNANFYALEKLIIWEDLKDKRKIKNWSNVYISALKDYILNKKLYYQLRILDLNGNEKILLKYDEKTNTILETPSDKLQNKAHRGYFKEAVKLKKGEFYISPMTLNIENGMIEKPYVPVVRYATPIVDANGEIKGVIVLNFNATYILDEIATTKSTDETGDVQKYYLLNEEGYYLFIGDKTKRWGFQLGTDYSFKRDYPNVIEGFKDKDETTFIKDGRIFSMHKVYPNKSDNRYRFWYLVTEIDEDVALASLDTFVNIFFIILSIVLVSGLFLINSYITKLMNPLTQVTSQLKALSNGEIKKEEIVYNTKDEIGQIVNSTNILVDAIETTVNQANAVANGDFTKEMHLLSKNDKLGLAILDMTKRLKEITILAEKLSVGNYDTKIIVKSSDDKLGMALVDMIKYLELVTNAAESIAEGKIDVDYKAVGGDDRLGISMLKMISYLRGILSQADAITREDFSHTIEVKSKDDELGIALGKMTEMLESSSVKNRDEIYFSDGIGEFSDKLTGIGDTIELSKQAITMACRYVDASSGVIYTLDKEKGNLNLVASFAYIERDSISNIFKLGEGVVGQVALEREPILLKIIKDNSYDIQSGTTISKPKEVFTFPLIHEGELFGVAEMMSFEGFTKIHKDYLLKIAAIFATSLYATTQNVQIKTLLEDSKRAYEELQVQSEELQESNVQMEEQQQQLTLQAKDMKQKNQELTRIKDELDIRADELERSSKYKSEFLANMSHELRTPLNSIILLSKLLTQNRNETLDKDDKAKTAVINKAGSDLLLLINDILDLSKVESGNMELHEIPTSSIEIFGELDGLFSEMANEKDLKFNLSDEFGSSFMGDKTKLLQVLKNLISNAFKFTKHGEINVSLKKENDKLIFEVRDSGLGIAKDKLDLIFEAFKQVDGSISRNYGGTGLGLSISKTFIDLMGGDIVVESNEGEGSKFTIVIPFHKSLEAQVKVEEKLFDEKPIIEDNDDIFETDLFNGKNILIVDDDSRNIFTLSSTLQELGAETFTAMDGLEALGLLEEEKIDLVLMDLMMPVMDGLEAIKKMKADDRFKDIPIIVVTAKTMKEDKEMSFKAGADDYLTKPIDHSALISMLKAWCK